MNIASAFRDARNLVSVSRLADGVFVDVNPAFAEMLGFTRDEIIGKTAPELNIWPDPDQRRALLEELKAGGDCSNRPVTFRTRSGRPWDGLLTAEIIEHDGEHYVFTIIQDIAAHNEREEAIRHARERYRQIFENAVEGIYQSSIEGRFVSVNPSMARILGYESPAELVRSVNDIGAEIYTEPGRRRELQARVERDGAFQNVESRVRRRDGSVIWISENSHLVRDVDGNPVSYEGTFVDITARKAAEHARQQSEEKFRTLVEHSQDGVFIVLGERYLYVNRAYAEMLGYDEEELTGLEYIKAIAPEDRDKVRDIWRRRRQGEWERSDYEVRLLHRDGRTRVVASVRAGPIRVGDRLASMGTVRDITSARESEKALRDAEQKYRSIFENSVVGIYQSTPDGRFLDMNPAMAEIFGYDSPTEMVESIRHIRDIYEHPEDREAFLEQLNRSGAVRGLEYRIRRKDAELRWVSQNSRVVRSDSGDVLYYEGILQDITDKKTAIEELHRSEQRYRTLVEHSQVGVFINQDGYYTYVNHAFASMLGYTEAELTGAFYRDIFPPEGVAAADERYRKRQHGEHVPNNYEAELLHKDGHTRVVVTISIGVFEQDGKRMMSGTVRDITEQKRFERQLRHNATHDPLTGLPNRTYFIEHLERCMATADGSRQPRYAVLFLDLDGFKLINDSLGHAAGDDLLTELAERLRTCMGAGDVIARHGGDEFTILTDGLEGLEDATDLAERLLAELSNGFDLDGHEVFTSGSIGIAPGYPHYRHTDELLRDADTAMYRAKATGRSFVIFDQSMHARARARLRLETELRRAQEKDEFTVFYQPIVSLDSRQLQGFEALLRWNHPERGLLNPGEFLRVAEETGMILNISWWALDQVCKQLAEWQSLGGAAGKLNVSINIADQQFAHPALQDQIIRALTKYGVAPSHLQLEITERVFMENPRAAEQTMRRLHRLGTPLYIDDFGTGYSSLSYLRDYPMDTLKIDRSFIVNMHRSPQHKAIVRTIIQLAADLGMNVIAEGIESDPQVQALQGMNCPFGQGNHFCPAVPAEQATRLLDQPDMVIAE